MHNLSKGVRAVVLDDELFQLKVTQQQLRNLGVEHIAVFLRGDQALAHVAERIAEIDIVCCDLQMPGMDGVEFVRKLAEIGFGGKLVLASGEDAGILLAARRLAESRELHLCGAFRKPLCQDQLAAALATAKRTTSDTAAAARPAYTGDELSRAMDGLQLRNHYQPKVDMQTGALVGVESLVRWEHPEHGLIFPDKFIHVAEDCGLIDRLTELVMFGIRGAFRQCHQWRADGIDLHVAVNVSTENLKHPSFADAVLREAALTGIDCERITIEVTESRATTQSSEALDILTRLRLRRVNVSIDDFGTGYSSLSQLKDLPFNELKIDRSFVRGANRDSKLSAILLPSLDMARQLGIKTVAEGIEEEEDWQFLRSLGCDLAQGYFIGRPMPPERLPMWLADWNRRRASVTERFL